MKIRHAIGLTGVVLFTACTNHLGTYSNGPSESVYFYTFKKSKEFDYCFYSDFGWSEKGSGKYHISKDTIIFNFKKNDSPNGSSYVIEKFGENETEFSIDLTVKDFALWEPLWYPIAILEDEVRVDSVFSNSDSGKSSFKYPFHGNPIMLKIGSPYQNQVEIMLDKPGLYSIDVKMKMGLFHIPTQKRIFRIEKFDKDTIIFGNFKDSYLSNPLIRK